MKNLLKNVLFLFCWGGIVLAQEVEFLSTEVATPEETEVEILNPDMPNIAEIEKEETPKETSPLPETDADFDAPLETVQDYWKLCDISDSYRALFTDGTPWTEGDATLEIRFRAGRMPLEMFELWSQPQTELDKIDAWTPEDLRLHRFDAFRVDGTLRSVKEIPISEEIAVRFQLGKSYACEVVLDDGRVVTIFCEKVPRALQTNNFGEEVRVGADTIFLKRGPMPEKTGEAAPKATLYMLSQRLAWYPPKLLSRLGMDYGLFDDLDRKELGEDATRSVSGDLRLSSRNRECFYQLMHKTGRIRPEEWRKIIREARKNDPQERFVKNTKFHSVLPLFQKPIAERGNFFFLRGVARQIVPVEVPDEDINQRFGITRYYEIFMYTEDSQQNPVAVLVRQLPKGIVPGDAPGYRVDLMVPAFFFNTWGYHSQDREGKPAIRLMPLLIGGPPQLVENPKPQGLFWFQVIMTILFSSLMLVGVVSFFTFNRGDRRFWKEGTIGKQIALAEGETLNGEAIQDIEAPPVADFTHWGQLEPEDEDAVTPLGEEPPEQA